MSRLRGSNKGEGAPNTGRPTLRKFIKQAGRAALIPALALAGSAVIPAKSTSAENAMTRVMAPSAHDTATPNRKINQEVQSKVTVLASQVLKLAERGFRHTDPNVSYGMVHGGVGLDEVGVNVGSDKANDGTRAAAFSLITTIPAPASSHGALHKNDLPKLNPHEAQKVILTEGDRTRMAWTEDTQNGSWSFVGFYPSSPDAPLGSPLVTSQASTMPTFHEELLNPKRSGAAYSQGEQLLRAAMTDSPGDIPFSQPFK